MTERPSTSALNGRGANGRFGTGNRFAKGNPFAKRVARLRSELYKAVSPADLREVLAALLAQAKRGDVASIKELLQRLLGPPEAIDLMERLEALELKIAEASEKNGNP